jgi:branched-chain amino acid aminotransferase
VIDEIAPECGFTVEEKLFKLDELLASDEVFLTGTAAEIIGVNQVDDSMIGDGRVGPVTQALTAEYRRRIAENAPED